MQTFVINIPKGTKVIYNEDDHKLLIGVGQATAAHPFADTLTLHCCPGSPEEDLDATASYTLTMGKRGSLRVEHL